MSINIVILRIRSPAFETISIFNCNMQGFQIFGGLKNIWVCLRKDQSAELKTKTAENAQFEPGISAEFIQI